MEFEQQEEREIVEHRITIDENMEAVIKIPKNMTALEFKGITSKANKLFNLSETKIRDDDFPATTSKTSRKTPKPKKRKRKMFSDESAEEIYRMYQQNTDWETIQNHINEKYGLDATLHQIKTKAWNMKSENKTNSDFTKEIVDTIIQMRDNGYQTFTIMNHINQKHNTNFGLNQISQKIRNERFRRKKNAKLKSESENKTQDVKFKPIVEFEIINLVDEGNMTHNEIAEHLNNKYGTVYSRQNIKDKVKTLNKQGRL